MVNPVSVVGTHVGNAGTPGRSSARGYYVTKSYFIKPCGAVAAPGGVGGFTDRGSSMAKLFFSYSHDDEQYRDQLEKHLAPLQH